MRVRVMSKRMANNLTAKKLNGREEGFLRETKKGRARSVAGGLRPWLAKSALAVTAGLSAASAQAGFVDDFLDETQAYVNVTQGGVLQAANMNMVTGGGFVFKAPRKEFSPFSVTPPSLRANCGGIDIFLGAFSIPSREEFVSFLKSVGTALPGVAFQLALQYMSPDLNEMVGRYSDMIRGYTNRYSDACTAAQSLMEDTGAKAALQKAVFGAKNALRASGSASDQSEADRLVRDNGEKAIDEAPIVKDSSGNVVSAPEINLTWALINSGSFKQGNSQELKEVMMTLVGTTIYTKSGSGADAVLTSTHYSGADLLPILFGEVRDGAQIERLKCDEATRCLKVTATETADASLVDQLQAAADNYRKAVRERNAALVSDRELMLLGGTTSVPLLRILNMAASSRYQGIADDLVRIYVEAAAFELIASAVNALAGDIRTALTGSAAREDSAQHVEHVKALEERIRAVQDGVYQRQDRLLQSMQRASSLIVQLEHIEKSLAVNQASPTMEAWPRITEEFK